MKTIKSEGEFRDITGASGTVLVDFFATWCEPCKWLDSILESIDASLPDGSLILKIDSDLYSNLASEYEVRSVPTLLLFVDGKVAWRMNGFKTGPELLEVMETFSRGT
ncbi:MAG: thioredoxin family protein [Bacteroidetes bacterium]|nr:thioredoxin family protein [Bacteroidota bacterium]